MKPLAPLLLAFAAAPALAQTAAPAQPELGPRLPARGIIVPDTARDLGVLAQVKVPEGFSLSIFAGPPVAMYPTVVAPAPDGSVYVASDLNLAQGAVKGRGRVLRLVDENQDGRADRYSIFAEMDSPRGIAVDGNTVFVMQPPHLVAYRDRDGDGIADTSDVIVRDLGYGLDVRSADHSTNNVTLAIDGWLYVAVGDYGYLNATGKDGRTITNRGGAVVRVRPDGTGLEAYTIGTRNIYDVGVSPFGQVFARDNTNDGDGWDTRIHYAAPGAHMGYPSLYKHFAHEHMPSIADHGAGAGTGGLWVQDPGFPDDWNDVLYTGDWTVNRVIRHRVTPRGATFAIDSATFVVAPRVVDMAMDDRSHLYVASLVGGVFNYMGDTVGAIIRVGYPGRTASRPLRPASLAEARLLDALASPNAEHRLLAQRELLRRRATPAMTRGLERIVRDAARPAEVRAAALFTLALRNDRRSLPALRRAASDPALRAVALKAIAESPALRAAAPASLFVRSLADPDGAVKVQAIAALVALDARDSGADLARLLGDPDTVVSHLAARAIARLGARDAALAVLLDGSPAARTRARHALQLMHETANVDALVGALRGATDPDVRRELVLTLARLANREAPYRGEWWGTRPNTVGPYFAPVAWEGTVAIRPVLREALLAAHGADFDRLVDDFARNRVLPLGVKALLASVGDGPARTEVVNALIGSASVPASAAPLLERLDGASAQRLAVAGLLAAEDGVAAELAPLVLRIVSDSGVPFATRGQVLAAVGRLSGDVGLSTATTILARMNPVPPPPGAAAPAPPNPNAVDPGPAALDQAWRRFVGARERQAQLAHFATLARGADPAQRVLGYAVLVQAVRNPRWTPEPVMTFVRPVLDAAWADPTTAASLAQAIRIMRVEGQYAERMRAFDAQAPR